LWLAETAFLSSRQEGRVGEREERSASGQEGVDRDGERERNKLRGEKMKVTCGRKEDNGKTNIMSRQHHGNKTSNMFLSESWSRIMTPPSILNPSDTTKK